MPFHLHRRLAISLAGRGPVEDELGRQSRGSNLRMQSLGGVPQLSSRTGQKSPGALSVL